MPRLFLSNFDFEAALVSPSASASRDAIRRNSELAMAWLAIARPGDVIVAEQLPDATFDATLIRLHRTGVRFAHPGDRFDDDLVVTPWGWERRVIGWADSCGLAEDSPPLHSIAFANSREFSFSCERDLSCGLDGQAVCCTVEDAGRVAASLERWIIKANFGASGRERIIGSGPPTNEQCRWLDRRLQRDGAVFVEPFVEPIEEVGIQWEIPKSPGEPELVGAVPLLSDERGQYRGSLVSSAAGSEERWQQVIDVSRKAARRAQELGYFGPLGIDAMRYRDARGHVRDRPLQDINARWTMGRLALGWRDRAPGNGTLILRVGPEQEWSQALRRSTRCVRISPQRHETEPFGHMFWLEAVSGE